MFWQKFIILLVLLNASTFSFADEPTVAKNVDVIKIAPKLPKNHIIVINLSGRGDKDIFTVARALGVSI